MNIIINESTLKNVIYHLLTEKLGVPDNTLETALSIYKELVRQMYSPAGYNEQEKEYNLTINGDFTLGKKTFNYIPFTVKITEHPSVEKMDRLRMATVKSGVFSDAKLHIIPQDTNRPKFFLEIIAPENWAHRDIVKYLLENSNDLVTTLGHELTHFYNDANAPHNSATELANYGASQKVRFNLKPIDKFFYYSYFIHNIESTAHVSEFATDMQFNKISKSNFLKFLNNHKMFKTLKEIQSFSIKEMKEELHNYIPRIDEIYADIENAPHFDNDEDKINGILRLAYVNLANSKGESLYKMIATSFFEQLTGNFSTEQKHNFFISICNIFLDFNLILKCFLKQKRKISTSLQLK